MYLATDTILEQSLNNLITFSRESQSVLMIFIALLCSSDLFLPFTVSFIFDLTFFDFLLLFIVLYNHLLYFYKKLVDI